MKRSPTVFPCAVVATTTLPKRPDEMSRSELIKELAGRMHFERKLQSEITESKRLLHELEVHQLELEIQNREVLEAHRELEVLNEKYVELYDFALVGYLSLDPLGKILELNLTAAKVLGQERHLLVGAHLVNWVVPCDKKIFQNHLSGNHADGEKTRVCEVELKSAKGSVLSVELHTRQKQATENEPLIIEVALIDVSEKHRAKAFEERADQLAEESELRERFVSTLSHDLRTPLTSSKLCAEMLNGAMNDIEKKKRLFQIMVEELDRADRMVRELLDASRMKVGTEVPMALRRFNLGKAAARVVENFQTTHPEAAINFRSEGHIVGLWSRDGLQRVLENLLSNAFKYGDNQQSITVALEDHGDDIILTVHNHGCPLSASEQKMIFNAFHRGDSAKNTETSGWGLGLSLVRNIVHRHHGQIRVSSSVSEGTSFIVELPKARSAHAR